MPILAFVYRRIPFRGPIVASVPGVVLSDICVGSVLMLGSGMLVEGTGMVISVVGITVLVVGAVVTLVVVVPLGSNVFLLQAQAHRENAKASTKAKMIIFFICILLFKDFNSSIS